MYIMSVTFSNDKFNTKLYQDAHETALPSLKITKKVLIQGNVVLLPLQSIRDIRDHFTVLFFFRYYLVLAVIRLPTDNLIIGVRGFNN